MRVIPNARVRRAQINLFFLNKIYELRNEKLYIYLENIVGTLHKF